MSRSTPKSSMIRSPYWFRLFRYSFFSPLYSPPRAFSSFGKPGSFLPYGSQHCLSDDSQGEKVSKLPCPLVNFVFCPPRFDRLFHFVGDCCFAFPAKIFCRILSPILFLFHMSQSVFEESIFQTRSKILKPNIILLQTTHFPWNSISAFHPYLS